MDPLKVYDPEIFDLIQSEEKRQMQGLELIASENFCSRAIIEAMGSCPTNKYAEGYPKKRYYGGCEIVDDIEDCAINRVKALFDAEYANVQPHSGSQANMAAYMAFLKPGDKVLGMDLSNGGHLTHGSPVNFSGLLYDFSSYKVNYETEMIDYDELEKQALEVKPKLIVAGASAYSRELDFARFRDICDKVEAILLVDMAHIAGLVATSQHPSPVPFADVVTSTTHKTLRGPRGGLILGKEKWGKSINKSLFPGSQGGPLLNIIAAKAVCFKEAAQPEFKEYCIQVVNNAKILATALSQKGLRIVSGGTDTHLFSIDLTDTGFSGKLIEKSLVKANITVNKNTIPRETRSPFVTSGVRIGTPAVTTRGMKEPQMEEIADYMYRVIQNPKDDENLRTIGEKVISLTDRFPFY
ncbi:serine hydroxymethyltransferase [Candidatus Riflebacteria bacterium]